MPLPTQLGTFPVTVVTAFGAGVAPHEVVSTTIVPLWGGKLKREMSWSMPIARKLDMRFLPSPLQSWVVPMASLSNIEKLASPKLPLALSLH